MPVEGDLVAGRLAKIVAAAAATAGLRLGFLSHGSIGSSLNKQKSVALPCIG